MTLSTNELVISISIAVVLGGSLAYLFWKQRKEAKQVMDKQKKPEGGTEMRQLQLQAYERLILLVDRIALPNLINRVNQPDLKIREMQSLLVHTIKQEFEYNITQQIYVTSESWDAVRNLKDQNILIVNQIASYLPAEATGQDLNRSILEMLMQNPKASLQNIVSEVLSIEAKKLMQ